jgi:predicted DNA-binding protein YlxM (UPF0122 family)
MSETDIVQRLIDQREGDLDAKLLEYDLPLLTDRQAEVLLRYHLTTDSVSEIAEKLDISTSRVYNARQDAEAKLRDADTTIRSLRNAMQVLDEIELDGQERVDGSERA